MQIILIAFDQSFYLLSLELFTSNWLRIKSTKIYGTTTRIHMIGWTSFELTFRLLSIIYQHLLAATDYSSVLDPWVQGDKKEMPKDCQIRPSLAKLTPADGLLLTFLTPKGPTIWSRLDTWMGQSLFGVFGVICTE